MAFPEFDAEKQGVLWFTRGRGRGHAIPDMEIVKELEKLRDDLDVRFVSYGTGARTFEEHGIPLIDIDLPDRNPINETFVLAGKLVGWLDPTLVIAHEEFPALPAAKIFDKPTVMVTDWFSDPTRYTMQSLKFADRIIFIDEPAVYTEPEWVEGTVDYVGPVIRQFEYTRKDHARARKELGIHPNATVIGVFPGSWTEADVPVLDLVLDAFGLLSAQPKHLIWLAGADQGLIAEKTADRDDVTAKAYDPEIDRIMAASNLAITKSNRKTLLELEQLGIRSIALSHGGNPIDEQRAESLALVRRVDLAELDGPEALARMLEEQLGREEPVVPDAHEGGQVEAAKKIGMLLVDLGA
jgi:predicted glycosyltransferase